MQPAVRELYYANPTDNGFRHVFPSKIQVGMCSSSLPIVRVVVESDPEGEYVGWVSTDRKVTMIFANIVLLKICFPYGLEAAIESGRGQVVKLKIRLAEDGEE